MALVGLTILQIHNVNIEAFFSKFHTKVGAPVLQQAVCKLPLKKNKAAGLLETTSTETLQESTDWNATGETLLRGAHILQLLTSFLLALSRFS